MSNKATYLIMLFPPVNQAARIFDLHAYFAGTERTYWLTEDNSVTTSVLLKVVKYFEEGDGPAFNEYQVAAKIKEATGLEVACVFITLIPAIMSEINEANARHVLSEFGTIV